MGALSNDFFEVASRAAHEGRLEEDEHYTFVRKGNDGESLRVNLSKSHDIVKRYAREYDVSEEILDDRGSYNDRLQDCTGAAYQTHYRQLSPPVGRCVGIDPKMAEESLDGFSRSDWDQTFTSPRGESLHAVGDLQEYLCELIEEYDVEDVGMLKGIARTEHSSLDLERVKAGLDRLKTNGAVMEDSDGLHVV